jgi:GNAT superfamily N-acetyltransferase
LVDNLRTGGAVLASLVAEIEDRIVGHILFSRMWIESSSSSIEAVALAPLAVLPECQRRGIGGELIRHGLDLSSFTAKSIAAGRGLIVGGLLSTATPNSRSAGQELLEARLGFSLTALRRWTQLALPNG